MKTVKEEMVAKAPKKLIYMFKLDCRKQQVYMLNSSLFDSRIEFKYQSNMLETRTTMRNKYTQKAYPHCREGLEDGVEEAHMYILESCTAYTDLRSGLDPLLVQQDRVLFLCQAITRRKLLEQEL